MSATNVLRVTIVLLFVGFAVWAISLNHFDLVIANHQPWLWLTTALVSVGPELAGIVIGVVTIDYLNERRQTEQLKAQLIRQMGTNIRDVAVTAAMELAHRGWLFDGSLERARFVEAELNGANLRGARLERTNLESINLSEAHLENANLSDAFLWRANLRKTDFRYANLGRAYLEFANLSGALLGGADLVETDFEFADLSGASLWKANLSRADLTAANLSGANLLATNLREADFCHADLSSANLSAADLTGASLRLANLSKANFSLANLTGIVEWTVKQLEEVETLEAAVMPDGVQLHGSVPRGMRIKGPTFEEWKAQYLLSRQIEVGY